MYEEAEEVGFKLERVVISCAAYSLCLRFHQRLAYARDIGITAGHVQVRLFGQALELDQPLRDQPATFDLFEHGAIEWPPLTREHGLRPRGMCPHCGAQTVAPNAGARVKQVPHGLRRGYQQYLDHASSPQRQVRFLELDMDLRPLEALLRFLPLHSKSSIGLGPERGSIDSSFSKAFRVRNARIRLTV